MTDKQTGYLPEVSYGTQVKISFSELNDYRISDTTILFMLLQQKQCFVQNDLFSNPHPFSRLIVAQPSWKKGNKQRTLEIGITKNRVLKLTGRTYTEEEVTSKSKWSFQVEKATGYLYPSDYNNQFGLVQVNRGKRQFVDFLSIQEENKFSDSKVGIIYELMSWLRSSRFEGCFRRLPELRAYQLSHYAEASKRQNKDLTSKIINGQMISIYADKDANSQSLAKKMVNAINVSRLDITACYSEEKHLGLNIQVVRDLRDNPDKIDGYQKSKKLSIIQHVTVENFGENEEKALLDPKADFLQKDNAMIKVLQELAIKQDIALRTLRMVPREELEYISPYVFYYLDWNTSKKKPKKDWNVKIACLKVDLDAGMEFKKSSLLLSEANAENLNDLQKIGSIIIRKYSREYHQVAGVVRLNQVLYVIFDTQLMTLPSVNGVHKQLALANPQRLISRGELLKNAKSLKLAHKYTSDQAELVFLLKNIPDEKLSIERLLSAVKEAHMSWRLKVLSEFNKSVNDNLGIWIKPVLRSKKNRGYWDGFKGCGLLSIDGLPHYFVAANTPLKNTYRKAIRLKRIEVIGDSDMRVDEQVEQHFSDFQRMMEVTFVRNGQSTVVPFPLKYLREYLS